MTHFSPIIALNTRFRLEKVYTYGQGEVCHHNFNFIVIRHVGTVGFVSRHVLKNIGLLDYIFSCSNYRPLPIPEVTFLSPKFALKFRLSLEKSIFGQTNASEITSSYFHTPARFGTIGFVSKRPFQKYIGKWD